MLAVRMTLLHFSVSSAMCFPKSAGVPPRTIPLSSAKRALMLVSASATLISPLSLSMISAGVLLGAAMPFQAVELKARSTAEPGLLRRHVRERLPRYAIPSRVVMVDAVPMLPSGKHDIVRLRQELLRREQTEAESVIY